MVHPPKSSRLGDEFSFLNLLKLGKDPAENYDIPIKDKCIQDASLLGKKLAQALPTSDANFLL